MRPVGVVLVVILSFSNFFFCVSESHGIVPRRNLHMSTSSSSSTSGNRQTKTTTIERNVDDDYTNGSKNVDTVSTTTKTKSKTVTSPYAIPKDISVSTISTTTSTKSGRQHHNKTENSDDTIIIDNDDDNYNPNATTPISDMLDIVNENMNRSSSSSDNKDGVFVSNGKIVLPPEHEPNETWIIAIVTLFTSMAISLCITTAIRRCRKRRRTGYSEIDNIVV